MPEAGGRAANPGNTLGPDTVMEGWRGGGVGDDRPTRFDVSTDVGAVHTRSETSEAGNGKVASCPDVPTGVQTG